MIFLAEYLNLLDEILDHNIWEKPICACVALSGPRMIVKLNGISYQIIVQGIVCMDGKEDFSSWNRMCLLP